MLQVKQFQFPSFDDWISNKYSWGGQIGDVHATVHPVCWRSDNPEQPHVMNITEYAFAIAASDVPSNIYVRKIFYATYERKYNKDASEEEWNTSRKQFQEWYERTAAMANEVWTGYVKENYLLSDGNESKNSESLDKE